MADHVIQATWPVDLDEVVGGDHVVALAYVTPASGVVITPVTNFALRDREAGRVSVNSSVGAWRKLERMRRNPRVALAWHTREHSRTRRGEYVLVQGRASFPWPPDRDSWYPEMDGLWDAFEGGVGRDVGPVWERWMSVYHWRVNVWVDVERVVVWPDLDCRGAPAVHGAPLPAGQPAAQSPPRGGTGPRVNHRRVARRARRLPSTLLGWAGPDGYPVVVPAGAAAVDKRGIALRSAVELPPGGRRAGLTSHSFARGVVGQEQRVHTGWLEDGVYAPHTARGYRFPASPLLYKFVVGFETRRRLREARRAGVLPEGPAQ